MPLSRALGLSVEEFKTNVLRFDEEDKCWELPEPCPLLEGKLCRAYDDRPQECRDYPNLHHDFRSHSMARFANAEICPVVFNVIEALKFELRWPGLRRWRGQSRRKR
jgi:Fe-S-cluster containining protein